MPMPHPNTALLLTALLAATVPAHAFQSADPNFKGLPGGGGLDAQRVTEMRYGEAAKAAPESQSTGPQRERPAPRAADPAPPAAAPAKKDAPRQVRDEAQNPPQPKQAAAPERIKGALATVWLERRGAASGEAQAPLTFGQVFAPGALASGARLSGRLADGKTVPLQVDVKARHGDGSVRHAIVSAIVPAPKDKPLALGLFKADGAPAAAGEAAGVAALLRAGLSAAVSANVGGATYTASLERLLARGAPPVWLAGPVAQEWHASAPLVSADGKEHPHLAARFAVRWYPALKKARVDVTVENNWAFEPGPQNFTYDARFTVGGKTVYEQAGLTHYHHARWRKLAWWGGAPALHLRHDPRQLIATRAVPNYDDEIQVDERALSKLYDKWQAANTPMATGAAIRGMGNTGGRPDIGLLPGWAAMYLLGMEPRAADVTFGTADLAGSWSTHYRDRNSGRPVSLIDYPYMTIVGKQSDTRNPATRKFENFPPCTAGDACKSPNKHDLAHQPNFAYLPYLLTGDYYYLEELQFWAMWNVFSDNPYYREFEKGLVSPDQVRGQAWSLRTLAEVTYITPDADRLKAHFLQVLDSNLDWYNAEYPANRDANRLGIVTNGYAVLYKKGAAVAPWQDDFFTSAVGHAAELGFRKAEPLLKWKAAFPVARMTGAGSCWLAGSSYSLQVRDTRDSPYYTSIAQVYQASLPPEAARLTCDSAGMAAALKVRSGEMTGYAYTPTGFPSNMQPALAYAADALGEPGRKAWRQFMARSVKPNYGQGPQFGIVPRQD